MTKLSKREDKLIKKICILMQTTRSIVGWVKGGKTTQNENIQPYLKHRSWDSEMVCLSDAGRAYAIERGWLAAEAAPVAAAVEDTALKVGDRVLASEVCIGDTLYRRVYGEGVVKAIMHDTLSDKGVPYDIRFTFEDGREMFCDRDYHVFRKPTQTALPALPDSQFVDSGTHVRVDSELIDKNEAALGNWQATNDYARKLESELAAARAEIAALQKRVIDFAEWHFDGADPFRYKLIETVISLVECEKRATES